MEHPLQVLQLNNKIMNQMNKKPIIHNQFFELKN